MGEISEMILDGTLCQGCGAYLGEGDGYPANCPSCARDNAVRPNRRAACEPRQKATCPICKKRVNVAGLKDHNRDVHAIKDRKS